MLNIIIRCGALAAFAFSTAVPVSAADTGGATGQDTNFAVRAAQGGQAEVTLAAMAMKKSKNATVLAFARMMNADHTKNNAQLATIVKRMGGMPPSDVGPDNKAVAARLSALSGTPFDAAYLQSQVTAHQKMLALMQTEVTSGRAPALVAFAKQTAPVVQRHLALAQSDVRKMGGSPPMSSSM
ncbi:MAG TPA: DUF4142 domain-containing protein [Candidatus Elarobacter sp.]|jgi:putative membrane protein